MLHRHVWNDVHEDWPFYTEQDRATLKRYNPLSKNFKILFTFILNLDVSHKILRHLYRAMEDHLQRLVKAQIVNIMDHHLHLLRGHLKQHRV